MRVWSIEKSDRKNFYELRDAVLKTVAYADVFDYPLTSMEIHRYLAGMLASREDVEQVLNDQRVLSARDGYYMLQDREELAIIRSQRKKVSDRMWPQAIGYGQLIARLPFVRMVAVTGSLAMNNVDRDPDIDYFIVSVPGRLWMVRAMVLAVTRLAAAKGVRLCPNYLVTQDALVFPDQSLYAAHELAQMVPIFGLELYEHICRLNPWKAIFLPNAQGLPLTMNQIKIRHLRPAGKSFFERLLWMSPGGWFEHWEMDRKIRMLSEQQRDSLESCFSADYCKGHNHQHGQWTNRVFRERLEGLHLEVPA